MIELKQGFTLQGGKYTIVRTLGQGSFGITYLAKTQSTIPEELGQLETTVNVAIKEFFMGELNSRAQNGSDIGGSTSTLFTNYQHRFRKEAENLSQLDHPNIVKVSEVFDENNTTYYVMQYIDGENLDDYIIRHQGIPEKEAKTILKDIGGALQYMHTNNMLHLDVKPKNVMMDKQGKCYLIDFGLSKQFTENGEPESSTKIGWGTVGYAPLEQANYRQDGTFPATLDVYALGATLYKMLSGVKPQDASVVLADGLDTEILEAKGVSIATIRSLKKAMAPIKNKRYQTVSKFLQVLKLVDKQEGNSQRDSDDKTTIETPDKLKVKEHSKNDEETILTTGELAKPKKKRAGKPRPKRKRPPKDEESSVSADEILPWFGLIALIIYLVLRWVQDGLINL